jgi:hypothetical protein
MAFMPGLFQPMHGAERYMHNTILPMEKPVLSDPSVFPDQDLLFGIIGTNEVHWQKLMAKVHARYPDAVEQWNYYKDGKNWLFRMMRRKKTLFWIGVLAETFRITFYFGDKAEPLIEASSLPLVLKQGFKTSKRYGHIRAISLRVERDEDIENALKLVDIRIQV